MTSVTPLGRVVCMLWAERAAAEAVLCARGRARVFGHVGSIASRGIQGHQADTRHRGRLGRQELEVRVQLLRGGAPSERRGRERVVRQVDAQAALPAEFQLACDRDERDVIARQVSLAERRVRCQRLPERSTILEAIARQLDALQMAVAAQRTSECICTVRAESVVRQLWIESGGL